MMYDDPNPGLNEEQLRARCDRLRENQARESCLRRLSRRGRGTAHPAMTFLEFEDAAVELVCEEIDERERGGAQHVLFSRDLMRALAAWRQHKQ